MLLRSLGKRAPMSGGMDSGPDGHDASLKNMNGSALSSPNASLAGVVAAALLISMAANTFLLPLVGFTSSEDARALLMTTYTLPITARAVSTAARTITPFRDMILPLSLGLWKPRAQG